MHHTTSDHIGPRGMTTPAEHAELHHISGNGTSCCNLDHIRDETSKIPLYPIMSFEDCTPHHDDTTKQHADNLVMMIFIDKGYVVCRSPSPSFSPNGDSTLLSQSLNK